MKASLEDIPGVGTVNIERTNNLIGGVDRNAYVWTITFVAQAGDLPQLYCTAGLLDPLGSGVTIISTTITDGTSSIEVYDGTGSHERFFFSLDFNYHGDRDDLFVAVKFFDKESGFKYRLGSEQQYGGRKMMHFNTMKDAAAVQSISAGVTFPTGMSTGDFTGFRMKLKSGPTGTGSAKNISYVEMHELAACAVFITVDDSGDDGSHCFGATCASGDWVPSYYFSADEKFIEAADGADCINQCGQMGYTSVNMPASCSGEMECYCQYAPSFDALKIQEDASSGWTNCYIGGS
jgi:hypothetical protein